MEKEFAMKTMGGRLTRAVAFGALAALALAACSSGSTGTSTSSAGSEKVTLKISNWGEFGFKELIASYEQAHPNVKIVQVTGDYAATHDGLQKSLIAGSGAADIAAIDDGYITQFANESDKFVNLLAQPNGPSFEAKYLPWKWKESLSPDGKTQIGLGTDVGGMAMCYRKDLFAKAGLPTDRDAVSALWPTWDAFITTGQKYVKATGSGFVDNATNINSPVLGQQAVGYFDTSNKLTLEPGGKIAFDMALKAYQAGISAKIAPFTPEWNASFKTGKFAVLACPAWMMAYIQGQAPNTSGNWDIAAVPGGGGNWGGSFLTIPKQGKHTAEAWAFLQYLSTPDAQLQIFKKYGNMPSMPVLYDDPALTSFKSPFFNNAPVGKIFSTSAKNLAPQFAGSKASKVRTAVENVLTLVQAGKVKPADAWAQATTEAQKVAAG